MSPRLSMWYITLPPAIPPRKTTAATTTTAEAISLM